MITTSEPGRQPAGAHGAVRAFPPSGERHDGIFQPRGGSTAIDGAKQRADPGTDGRVQLRPTGAFEFRAVRETLPCHRTAAYRSPSVEPGGTDRSGMF